MPPPAPAPVLRPKSPAKPIVRPLEAMRPEKYKNTDVKDLFPAFRENKVLRFSRLFPIKASNKPKTWRNLRRKFEKEAAAKGPEAVPAKVGRDFSQPAFPEAPDDPAFYVEDQAVRFHRPAADKSEDVDEGQDKKKADDQKAKHTDWRWGPAQYWYDMLNVPDKVEDFDYNLKLAVDSIENSEANNPPKVPLARNTGADIAFSEDAFLMVTQLNWEEDVIWNGEEQRHKVLQKLQSKNNAAGWVPSSYNRTAAGPGGSGAGGGGGGGGPGDKKGGITGVKLQILTDKRPTDANDTFNSLFPVENEELAYGRWEDEVIWDHEAMKTKLTPRMVSMDPNDDNIILGIPDDIDPSTLPSDEPMRKVNRLKLTTKYYYFYYIHEFILHCRSRSFESTSNSPASF